jgi:hypothetical protein
MALATAASDGSGQHCVQPGRGSGFQPAESDRPRLSGTVQRFLVFPAQLCPTADKWTHLAELAGGIGFNLL